MRLLKNVSNFFVLGRHSFICNLHSTQPKQINKLAERQLANATHYHRQDEAQQDSYHHSRRMSFTLGLLLRTNGSFSWIQNSVCMCAKSDTVFSPDSTHQTPCCEWKGGVWCEAETYRRSELPRDKTVCTRGPILQIHAALANVKGHLCVYLDALVKVSLACAFKTGDL